MKAHNGKNTGSNPVSPIVNLSRKYGEIGRFATGDFSYIINISKSDNKFAYMDLYVPWISIILTRRTSKKRKTFHKGDKDEATQGLVGNTFNLKTMRTIEFIIRSYLEKFKPPHIAITAYDDDFIRRIELYTRRLNSIGYYVVESIQDDYHRLISYFENKEYLIP